VVSNCELTGDQATVTDDPRRAGLLCRGRVATKTSHCHSSEWVRRSVSDHDHVGVTVSSSRLIDRSSRLHARLASDHRDHARKSVNTTNDTPAQYSWHIFASEIHKSATLPYTARQRRVHSDVTKLNCTDMILFLTNWWLNKR